MASKQLLFWSAFVAVALAVGVVRGDDGCSGGACDTGGCGQQCATRNTCTVMMPQWATEKRKIMETEWTPETPDGKFPVPRCIPETAKVERECTVMVAQARTRTETYQVEVPTTRNVTEEYQVQVPTFHNEQRNYTVSVPVWKQEEQRYTVMVPIMETRQAT